MKSEIFVAKNGVTIRRHSDGVVFVGGFKIDKEEFLALSEYLGVVLEVEIPKVSKKTINYLNRTLEKLKNSMVVNDIEGDLYKLMTGKPVEVGYRAQCGSTHITQKVFASWRLIISQLRKDGFQVSEENITHKNSYATNNQGFWKSVVFKVENI